MGKEQNSSQVTVNKDLARERTLCTFNTLELTNVLDGGADKTVDRRKTERWFLSDPELQDKVPLEYLSHKEKYEEAVRKSAVVFRKLEEMGGGIESYTQVVGSMIGAAVLKDGNPFMLHYVMFIPALLGQGTLEQQAEWVGRAFNKEILGTYAQTELGHGTFLRGLETTATYDPNTKEFILHSPTLTAYKWWPGGLGHTANFAVIMAQLYTKGQCHGIHPFIVQLRHEDTHVPLKGIKIGEIGTKLGFNTVNNGYLGFEHVRIPLNQMLMKNNKVLEDGTYVKAPNSKLTYGTMMFVRVVVTQDLANYLGKAVVIATRYSAVRRQSELKPGEPEPQIIEYKTQQYKLFPNIATVICYKFVSKWLWDTYNVINGELETGDLERLPELHALSCCLKAVCTNDGAAGIETCRLSCGGHGYMTCSNLPTLYGLATAAVTYEGENTVLFLQTARYLIKQHQSAKFGRKMPETVAYLSQTFNDPWQKTTACLINAFKQVSAGKVRLAAENLERRELGGISHEDAWNMTSIELVAAAEAHCRAFLVQKYFDMVEEINTSPALKTVLRQLVTLYIVHWTLNRIGDFLRFSNLPVTEVPALQAWLEELLAEIRPNAVGIVDSFDYCDESLSSALGAYDGRVYERLFAEAQKSPLNQEPVNISFKKYLKPFMKSNL